MFLSVGLLAVGGFVFLDERFVLNFMVINFGLLFRELHLHIMPLLYSSLMLSHQNIFMQLYLLLPLLHRHLHLMLLILKVKHLIRLRQEHILDLFDLQCPTVMPNQRHFLLLNDLIHVLASHLVLKLQLIVLMDNLLLLRVELLDFSLRLLDIRL